MRCVLMIFYQVFVEMLMLIKFVCECVYDFRNVFVEMPMLNKLLSVC